MTLASNMLSSSDEASPDFPEPFFAADFSLLAGSFRIYFTGYTSAFFPHSSYHKVQHDMIVSWPIYNYYESLVARIYQYLTFASVIVPCKYCPITAFLACLSLDDGATIYL